MSSSVTIPLLATSPTVLPRLRGDGMDSENLSAGNAPAKVSHRRKTLQAENTTSATTYRKGSEKRSVPREPVKAAVKAVNKNGANQIQKYQQVPKKKDVIAQKQGNMTQPMVQRPGGRFSANGNSAVKYQAYVNGKKGLEGISTGVSAGKDGDSVDIKSVLSADKQQRSALIPAVYSHIDMSLGNQMSSLPYTNQPTFTQQPNFSSSKANNDYNSYKQNFVPNNMPNRQDQDNRILLKPDQALSNEQVKEESVIVEVPNEDERSVEGSVDSSFNQQVVDLKEQLDLQHKVNADLKKLLVASMGDDLHHKVEAIVRTRAQLATDITQLDRRRKEEFEDIDNLTIQADMWRSKYMASRVLAETLRKEKGHVEDLKQHCTVALQQMMAERNQLHEDMVQAHRYLKLLRDSFDHRAVHESVTIIPNLMELSRTNLRLAGAIKASLLPTTPLLTTALDQGVHHGLSPAEKMAAQILTDGEPNSSQQKVLEDYQRFHPCVRYDNLTFNCCRKCKGDIQIV